ncbi:HEAT repeat domain-containing protein [Enhygromyxa salina]|uniref:Uncharacterized protein n=1 Tax=Enhygromyxa salina TaxID=215803 RepID=A0A2S9YU01_9BACT|nr:HEAT repeat domain-containing protein [Enhygromyxa salina]PRQ08591.1 hypothetical protein ENSA7_16730 [Enhygromyxa salina]
MWSPLHGFSRDPVDASRVPAAQLDSEDPRAAIEAITAFARRGDFEAVPRLAQILAAHDDNFVWYAGTTLLGLLAPWEMLQTWSKRFDDPSDRDARFHVSDALHLSCGAWAVEPLIAMVRATSHWEQDTPLYHLGRALSGLLDRPGENTVDDDLEHTVVVREDEWDQPTESLDLHMQDVSPDRHAYAVRNPAWDRHVQTRAEQLRRDFPDVAVRRGGPVDLGAMARRLLAQTKYGRLSSGERILFEAFTGIDCSGFYGGENRLLRPQVVQEVIGAFLNSDAPGRFRPGVRYFFGHEVPT